MTEYVRVPVEIDTHSVSIKTDNLILKSVADYTFAMTEETKAFLLCTDLGHIIRSGKFVYRSKYDKKHPNAYNFDTLTELHDSVLKCVDECTYISRESVVYVEQLLYFLREATYRHYLNDGAQSAYNRRPLVMNKSHMRYDQLSDLLGLMRLDVSDIELIQDFKGDNQVLFTDKYAFKKVLCAINCMAAGESTPMQDMLVYHVRTTVLGSAKFKEKLDDETYMRLMTREEVIAYCKEIAQIPINGIALQFKPGKNSIRDGSLYSQAAKYRYRIKKLIPDTMTPFGAKVTYIPQKSDHRGNNHRGNKPSRE